MIQIRSQSLDERFEFITSVQGVKIYDTRHAHEEFDRHFPELSHKDFKRIITDGVIKILDKYGLNSNGNYMVISLSTEVRVPVEIRQDRFSSHQIGAVPTTLAPHETFNLRDEVEVFVESNNNSYRRFPLIEGFNYYVQNGNMFTDFEEVEVR